jgi:peptidoglycan hydrolase CwlO-like protein
VGGKLKFKWVDYNSKLNTTNRNSPLQFEIDQLQIEIETLQIEIEMTTKQNWKHYMSKLNTLQIEIDHTANSN